MGFKYIGFVFVFTTKFQPEYIFVFAKKYQTKYIHFRIWVWKLYSSHTDKNYNMRNTTTFLSRQPWGSGENLWRPSPNVETCKGLRYINARTWKSSLPGFVNSPLPKVWMIACCGQPPPPGPDSGQSQPPGYLQEPPPPSPASRLGQWTGPPKTPSCPRQTLRWDCKDIGLFWVKDEEWTGFSEGWQGCSEGFPEGKAEGNPKEFPMLAMSSGSSRCWHQAVQQNKKSDYILSALSLARQGSIGATETCVGERR